jgi:hypothetical protein
MILGKNKLSLLFAVDAGASRRGAGKNGSQHI